MRTLTILTLMPAVAFAAACGRNTTPALDDGLRNDLSLVSQAHGNNAQVFISPVEQGMGQPANGYAASQPREVARQPVYSTPARRTTTTRRASSGGSSGSSGVYSSRQPAEVTVRHTHRDAVIGATAGAVIGATTSRDKVKGGLIGAAVGGVLGGVIGHNVDVDRRSTGW